MADDFLKDLGLLSFVTRLKRLSDAMIHDGRRLYKQLGIDIEPNWYVIFKLLQKHGELTVMEISEKIGFAHPSVISIVNKMIKAGYLEEKKVSSDSRKRLLVLTPRAIEKIPEFEKVWDAGVAGIKRMLPDLDALDFMNLIEERINKKGFRNRALAEFELKTDVRITDFQPELADDFARLNYEWIEDYFTVETKDRQILDNPADFIINRGGQIFFALINGRAVGTVALINSDEDSFELAKMAVSGKYRGLKIGDKLMIACLEYAKNTDKKSIFLLSNTKLVPAINLYKKFGFAEIPLDPQTPYLRTNIQMELILKKQ